MIRNVVAGRLRQAGDSGQRAADLALLQEGLARHARSKAVNSRIRASGLAG